MQTVKVRMQSQKNEGKIAIEVQSDGRNAIAPLLKDWCNERKPIKSP